MFERVLADEEKTARRAVYEGGPVTARSGPDRPYPRILLVPRDLQAVYDAKPRATVRLQQNVVEGGRSWDPIHAATCIEALVDSPEFAAIIAQASNDNTWDDVIGGVNPRTVREHSRRVCIKLISEKETGTASNDKSDPHRSPPNLALHPTAAASGDPRVPAP